MTSHLTSLFRHWAHAEATIQPLQAHASPRKIYRLTDGEGKKSAIGVIHQNKDENRAFIHFSKFFKSKGLSVPEIYAEDLSHDSYLQEDLGDETLLDRVKSARTFTPKLESIYANCLTQLVAFQFIAGPDLNYSLCTPVESHRYDALLWDLNYFKESFLKRSSVSFEAALLTQDLETFARHLSNIYDPARDGAVFMFRDFQARNIMMRGDTPCFIDYQSGRKGAPYLDVAMLLGQVSANIPEDARQRLLQHYYVTAVPFLRITKEEFDQRFHVYSLALLLHHLGTYGRFGIGAQIPYFMSSLQKAVAKLPKLLNDKPLPVKIPELSRVLTAVAALAGKDAKDLLSPALLRITVKSFSYKKGVPIFPLEEKIGSRSGGGFLFDCRCLQNPGREIEYKVKTGRDPEVIEFLENIPTVLSYREHVLALTKIAVENYLERGFTDLVIGFGCTGGQHRSVYFSEFLARHLYMNYPVQVQLSHRELGL